MKIITIILIFILLCQIALGQEVYNVQGVLTDCSDKKALIHGSAFLQQNDSVLAITYTGDKGKFYFNNLKPGTYKIRVNYFYYPTTIYEINIPTKEAIHICLLAENPDSLLTNYRPGASYVIYQFGLSKYSDKELNKVGEKYGLTWVSMGCVLDENIKKYNDTIKEIMKYKFGEEWENQFWFEVSRNHK